MNKYIYLYNNDITSLLTLIKYLYENNVRPTNIKTLNYQPNLLEETMFLDLKDDSNIYDFIIKNCGYVNLKIINDVFLSNDDNKELIIYYYYLNALKYKTQLIYMRNLNCVNHALKISKYVKSEAHRFKGYVRFKELSNKALYAEINPTNNIIIYLGNHFKSRLRCEYWIIKDINRNITCFYDKKDIYIYNDVDINIKLSDSELDIEDAWKLFYKTIGIKERKNDRCRMNFMPKKYWKNILEVKDEIGN